MITADEARKLSGIDPAAVTAHLKAIESRINAACAKHEREVIIRDNPYARWMYDSFKMPEVAKEVIQKLKDNGFEVSCYYKELSITVDVGLRIKW